MRGQRISDWWVFLLAFGACIWQLVDVASSHLESQGDQAFWLVLTALWIAGAGAYRNIWHR